MELRNHLNEAVSLTEAAAWLGISKTIAVDLVKVGLLVAERNPREGYPHWAFSRSALAECMEKVLKSVKECPSHKTEEKTALLDLAGAARLLFVLEVNAASILSYVAEGKLQAYYSSDRDLRLASLFFERSDLQQLVQSIKAENGWMSREELAKLLRVKV